MSTLANEKIILHSI